jgi:hypothetical protein
MVCLRVIVRTASLSAGLKEKGNAEDNPPKKDHSTRKLSQNRPCAYRSA